MITRIGGTKDLFLHANYKVYLNLIQTFTHSKKRILFVLVTDSNISLVPTASDAPYKENMTVENIMNT